MTGQNVNRAANATLAIVLLFCAIYAIRLGAFENDFGYQVSHSQCWNEVGCASKTFGQDAFASGGTILLHVPFGNQSSAAAIFEGDGKAETASVEIRGAAGGVARLLVNGRGICENCTPGKKYPINAGGRLEILLETSTGPSNQTEAGENPVLGTAFFDNSEVTRLSPEIWISVEGGWKAKANSKMPFSFYGVDAPFHIARIPILANHLSRMEWPWAFYTYFAAIPPALIYMTGTASAEAAHRIFAIILFFLPIAAFRLFSSKIPRIGNLVFLFSSLVYLFLPSNGLVIGGGPDIFFYGMLPQTIATLLFAVFAYFAYEYVVERKEGSLAPAVMLFFFSAISNQRILFVMPFVFFSLAAVGVATGSLRRTALLAFACAISIIWVLAPSADVTRGSVGYGAVGGASVGQTWNDALLGFIQTGYVLLPILFTLGVWHAYERKWLFPFFLSAVGISAYIFVASPEVNRAAPFIDGIRLLPSFFLISFFIGGIGLAMLCRIFFEKMKSLRARLFMDEITFAGAAALSVLVPCAVIFSITALTTMEQYSSPVLQLRYASEHSGYEKALRIVGAERFGFCGNGAASHHFMDVRDSERVVRLDCSTPDKAVEGMRNASIRYILYGNTETVKNRSNEGEIYSRHEALLNDTRLALVRTGGATPLFELVGARGSGLVEAVGAVLSSSEVRYDRAKFSGICSNEKCRIFYSSVWALDGMPLRAAGATVSYDKGRSQWAVDIDEPGLFEIEIEPGQPWFAIPLFIASLFAVALCFALSRKAFFS